MANRTVKDAHSVKGTNPQYLVEKIIRSRIYECKYWKEECFALTAALLVDKAMELKYVGGIFGGNIKPTPFLCLVLKMLQIQPEKDIIVEFLRNENFKYVRALGATYMRLVGTSLDCYKYLEPLYYDYRKLKRQKRDGNFELVHMDELIDELLREERVFDVILPRIQKRSVLEEGNQLEPRVSALEEDFEDMETSDEEDAGGRSPTPERRGRHKERSASPHGRSKRRSRSRDREKRHRSRSPADKSRHRDDDDRRRKHKKHRHDHKEDRHHKHRDSDRDRHRHRDKDRRDKRDDSGLSKEELEIKEANEQRAKLGLAPLKL